MAFKNRNMVLEMQVIANIIYGTGGSAGRFSANSIDSEQTPSVSTQSAKTGPSHRGRAKRLVAPKRGVTPGRPVIRYCSVRDVVRGKSERHEAKFLGPDLI